MKIRPAERSLHTFKKEVLLYYKLNKRTMPWRDHTSTYYVVISEIMLQQTQVDRVRTKFASFVKRFPDWKALAAATNHEVLSEWSGLGYNRRGLYLKHIAEIVAKNGEDCLKTRESLLELPGIGPNTAGSILAFAFNTPILFIETNIRSVFIHFFFKGSKDKIPDFEILPLIEKTLDQNQPREWYYALMDYGSYLKRSQPNPSRRSTHHSKQTPFKGSNRELRSGILKMVMKESSSISSIEKRFKPLWHIMQIRKNLIDLQKEGFLRKIGRMYHIS
jgi:A/G-specific adenine glycosylase